jgi:aminopeptidase N
MENPGMVTFAEEYLIKVGSTKEEKYNLANVVVH